MNINDIARFATDRLDDLQDVGGAISNEVKYAARQLRDKAVVPALDVAMESGVIPAEPGMYGRYLSGTSNPLTKMPADIKAAESLMNEKINQEVTVSPLKLQVDQAHNEWLELATTVDAKNEMYNVHGIGSPATKEEEAKVKQLDQNVINFANQLGVNRHFLGAPSKNQEIKKRQKNYTPTNYTIGDYRNMGGRGLDISQDEKKQIHKGLVNTLGRYTVKDGIIDDRYDFNDFMKPGDIWDRVGGINTGSGALSKFINMSGRAAHHLGFIKPGSGYDVKFDTGRR
tara:strand:- start:56 stop:910 length:855 start_codon:yes stop_codon:yes gene_type:complete